MQLRYKKNVIKILKIWYLWSKFKKCNQYTKIYIYIYI